MRKINKIIVHCSDSNWGDVEEIRRWHTMPPPKGNGWKDIGYHYVILNGYPHYQNWATKNFDEECDGLTETGRPYNQIGSHAAGYNEDSIGICLVGVKAFTPKQFASLKTLILHIMQVEGVNINNVIGHYECTTAHGKTCPNFDMAGFRIRLTDNKE
jgi:N-acetylmuramoyl-L-alanine amidase